MVGFWLLFFYTDVYGISAAAAGTIMMVARFWDMAIDPIIGVISDRTKTRWGKFRPYILFGAVPYAVLAILTFTTPNFGEVGKIIYAGATYVLLMTAYAMINLPYSALGAVMTDDTYERAGLNTYRFIAGFIGQFVVTGLALTLAEYFGHGDKAQGFQYTLFLFAGLSLVFFFITFQTTKERVQPPKEQKNSLKADFKNLFKNQAWVILAIVGIISFVMFAMQNAAIAYYFKYYLVITSYSIHYTKLYELKVAVLAPIPRANVMTARIVKVGELQSVRAAYLISRTKSRMVSPLSL